MDPEVDRLGSGLSASICPGESDVCILSDLYPGYEPQDSPTVAEIIDLESAILTAVLGKSPDPRWSGRLCAKAFTERLRFLMQHLTTATNDPLPLFFRIADADPHLRRYLFGRQRPGTRMEALSWYWRFLLMIILARRRNSRESGLSTI
jgi:hypothetical protein